MLHPRRRATERSETLERTAVFAEALGNGVITVAHVDAITRGAKSVADGARGELFDRVDALIDVAGVCTPEQFDRRVKLEVKRLEANRSGAAVDWPIRLFCSRMLGRVRSMQDPSHRLVATRRGDGPGEPDPDLQPAPRRSARRRMGHRTRRAPRLTLRLPDGTIHNTGPPSRSGE